MSPSSSPPPVEPQGPRVLVIDTSSRTEGIALVQGAWAVSTFAARTRRGHSLLLLPTIERVLTQQGWAVGNSGTILTTKDGGTNWRAQGSGTPQRLSSVYFTNERQGWAVGAIGKILATTDGGATWSAQDSGTSESLLSVYFINERQGWTPLAKAGRGEVNANLEEVK